MNDQPIAGLREGIPYGDALMAVVSPMIDGTQLLAIKCYFTYVASNGVRDVGAFNVGGDPAARFALNLGSFAHAAMVYPEVAEEMGFLYVGPRRLRRWLKVRDYWRGLKAWLIRTRTALFR